MRARTLSDFFTLTFSGLDPGTEEVLNKYLRKWQLGGLDYPLDIDENKR